MIFDDVQNPAVELNENVVEPDVENMSVDAAYSDVNNSEFSNPYVNDVLDDANVQEDDDFDSNQGIPPNTVANLAYSSGHSLVLSLHKPPFRMLGIDLDEIHALKFPKYPYILSIHIMSSDVHFGNSGIRLKFSMKEVVV
ncbi:hypothetical protein J1N35_002192 [Gossypium stocksii]|uniref:Uncharacterized protein n=1 Tax=Gossypium stocksii TaxID=47602 RepID=A0A9D3WLI1_9ROSI|nr:hypothetical protein J1N35_002192 [Gossypium stocksii]